MSTGGKCLKCDKGFLVEEYSHSQNKNFYYCNYCFKYTYENEAAAVDLVESSNGDYDYILTDEEIMDAFDRIFSNID